MGRFIVSAGDNDRIKDLLKNNGIELIKDSMTGVAKAKKGDKSFDIEGISDDIGNTYKSGDVSASDLGDIIHKLFNIPYDKPSIDSIKDDFPHPNSDEKTVTKTTVTTSEPDDEESFTKDLEDFLEKNPKGREDIPTKERRM